jgi:hypothetical protein
MALLVLLSEQGSHLTRAVVVGLLAIGFLVVGLHPALRNLPMDGDEPSITPKEGRIFVIIAVLLLAASVREFVLSL